MTHWLIRFAAAVAFVTTSAGAFAADKVVYQLDWLPSGEETFPYVAQKEGYFAAANLDVEIRIGRGTTDVLAKMSTGNAEFGSGGLGALMQAAAQGPIPVKAVLSIFNKQPDAIFTYEGSGIKTIKDLAGRTVATATFTSSNALWPVVADINGLDISKVKLIKTDPTATAAMVATGKADALINWVTSGGEIEAVLKEAGKKMVVLPWSEFGLDGYGLEVSGQVPIEVEPHPESERYMLSKALRLGHTLSAVDPPVALDADTPLWVGAEIPEGVA